MAKIQLSRSQRRVRRTTPGGTSKLIYKKRDPAKAKCAECGTVLPGVANKRPTKMQNMAKTKKRPERPYGGKLCTKCTRATLIAKARA